MKTTGYNWRRDLPWLYNCAFPVVTMEELNSLGFASPMGCFESTSYTMRYRLFAVKANANREQNLPSLLGQLCRDAALLLQRYKFSLKQMSKCSDYFLYLQQFNVLAAFPLQFRHLRSLMSSYNNEKCANNNPLRK